MSDSEFVRQVRQRLFDERVVTLIGHLDDASVMDFASSIWSLDALGDEAITLLVSCSGGTVSATAALLDILDVIGVDVIATCIGELRGPPLALLAGATRRQAAPGARFLLTDEREHFSRDLRAVQAEVDLHHQQRADLLSRLAAATKGRRSLGDLETDFAKSTVLSATEARDYGLIDSVLPEGDRLIHLSTPLRSLGFRRN